MSTSKKETSVDDPVEVIWNRLKGLAERNGALPRRTRLEQQAGASCDADLAGELQNDADAPDDGGDAQGGYNEDISQAVIGKLEKKRKHSSLLTGEACGDDVFDKAARTMEELAERLGQKWKVNAPELAVLAETYLPLAGDIEGKNPVMAIACTSRCLRLALQAADRDSKEGGKLKLHSYHKRAERLIKKALKVGLLVCVDERFEQGWKEEGTARLYVLNRRLAKMLMEKYGHSGPTKADRVSIGREVGDALQGEYPQAAGAASASLDKVRFSSKLRLPNSLTNEEIADALLRRYPALAHYWELVKELNARHYAEESVSALRIRLEPRVRRSEKYVTHIGIRAYSDLCSYPKRANDGQPSRAAFFKDYFRTEEVFEYDVPSSIYRVATFLNTRLWLDDGHDLYATMCPREFKDKGDRNFFKHIAMRLYFGASADKVAANLLHWHSDLKDVFDSGLLKEVIKSMREKMFTALGEEVDSGKDSDKGMGIDSEIFFHESCLYLDLHKYLVDKGLRIAQVYDGFYSNDPRLPALCKAALPEIARAYAARWLDSTR